ncbi:site-specific DNA-methyltransferase [Actinoplanes sp. GCM10030250]|uniref:site-specific DNA-methyltransferase n=1 Tax=Actinoplanes sp. GCM10030250 TaxID=3273376 RepID=UPI00361FB574
MSSGRLALTWYNQDKALLLLSENSYEWVGRDDPRVTEVRLFTETDRVGTTTGTAADNLLIYGESGNALKSLNSISEYAEQYRGRIKLIYIDPPFNTGQAFASYDDNFEHSVWLTMFRDRVRQLVSLLADDGTIWVHLDDAEVHRARIVLDEELGIDNFVGTVIWQKAYSPRNDAPAFSTDQDYILVYSKKPGWRSNRWTRLASRDALYKSTDGDPRSWVSGDPAAPSAHRNQTWVYAIQSPFTGELVYPAKGRCWGQSQDSMQALVEEWGVRYKRVVLSDNERRALICGVPVAELRKEIPALMVDMDLAEAAVVVKDRYEQGAWPRLYFTKGGNGGIKLKRYLDEISSSRAPQTLWLHEDVGHSRSAKHEMNLLFPDVTPFSTPKPERLLERVIQIGTDPGDVVLDCFAGSGTTAAVAHKMGRRWIAVELARDNYKNYAKPRLTQVVEGSEDVGITLVNERLSDLPLPSDVPVAELDSARKTLEKLAAAGLLDVDSETLACLIKQLRTKPSKKRNWHGGGGFRCLEIEPSRLEVVGGRTFLRPTAGDIAPFAAAQLGYRLTTDRRGVAGVKNRDALVVVNGIVDEEQIKFAVSLLEADETVTVAGLAVHPEASKWLNVLRIGSRAIKIPNGFYKQSKVVR